MAGDLIKGNIPDHWEFTTLGDVCQRGGGNIQTGPFGSQLHASDYVPVGIPSVMPTNIGDNRIVEDDLERRQRDRAAAKGVGVPLGPPQRGTGSGDCGWARVFQNSPLSP